MNKAQHQVIRNNVNANYDIRFFSEEMKQHYNLPYVKELLLPISNTYLGRPGVGQHLNFGIELNYEYPQRLQIQVTILL